MGFGVFCGPLDGCHEPGDEVTSPLLTGLALGRGAILRQDLRLDPRWWSAALAAGALAVEVSPGSIAVTDGRLAWRSPTVDDRERAVLIGVNDLPRIAVLVAEDAALTSLRLVGADLVDDEAAIATTAVALAQWHASHQHCPQCGSRMSQAEAGWALLCPADESVHYPRTDPAVIVLIRDDAKRALLGRRADWPDGWFSTLAGFVEAGETAERTLVREVAEEAGITVDPDRIVYRGSQPWPFPRSLMLGYHAWAGGDLTPKPDGTEIAEARWFTRSELLEALETGDVRLPPRVSIARRLVEDWYGRTLPGSWSRP